MIIYCSALPINRNRHLEVIFPLVVRCWHYKSTFKQVCLLWSFTCFRNEFHTHTKTSPECNTSWTVGRSTPLVVKHLRSCYKRRSTRSQVRTWAEIPAVGGYEAWWGFMTLIGHDVPQTAACSHSAAGVVSWARWLGDRPAANKNHLCGVAVFLGLSLVLRSVTGTNAINQITRCVMLSGKMFRVQLLPAAALLRRPSTHM